MSTDAVKEAQKQLRKQRAQEKRARTTTTSTPLPPQTTSDTEEDDSENQADDNRGQKRKRASIKGIKTGDTKKKQRLDQGSPKGSINEAHHEQDLAFGGATQESRLRRKPSKRSKKRHSKGHDIWTLSPTVGGRLLSIDPIFSHDEKFLLLATRRAALVYSTSNSLLFRKIEVGRYGFVTSLALSTTQAERLYIGTADGYLLYADWHNGRIMRTEKVGSKLISLTAHRDVENERDLLHYVDATEDDNGKRGCRLCRRSTTRGSAPKVLLDVSKPLKGFQVLAGGAVVIAASERHIFLGLINVPSPQAQDAHSTWHQVESTDPLTSICARQRQSTSSPGKATSRSSIKVPHVDLAVGTVRGPIFVYEDFVTRLTGSGSGNKGINSATRPVPRILHWHRGPVSTVKWSLDGNYLISGGSETVLVLWQMKTGKRQDLPHLTSAIESLTVSPSGTSYGIQLADNSAMVLSTAELRPSAHISSIQARAVIPEQEQAVQLRTVASKQVNDVDTFTSSRNVAATIHPLHSSQLLLAVPASQPRTDPVNMPRSAPFLQTYELSLGHSKSRQALTRNNATHFTTGPESNRIGEPDVTHLQISQDGMWLATIEEWLPPHSDLNFTTVSKEEMSEQRGVRLEVYLKFWRWDQKELLWILDTRIDSPHIFSDGVTPARVQSLKADPVRTEFVTSGGDEMVRIWRATTRRREDVIVRGQGGAALTVWSCRAALELTGAVTDVEDGSTVEQGSIVSRLAYSEDGSVIAVCYEDTSSLTTGTVRLIDAAKGTLKQSRPDLSIFGLKDVGFLDRYLVILSYQLIVYDLVDDALSYQHNCNSTGSQLATNPVSGTLAVALPTKKAKTCRVIVFDPTNPMPLYESSRLDSVSALLSLPSAAGYVLLNNTAEATTLYLTTSVGVPVIQDSVTHGGADMDEPEVSLPTEPNGNVDRDPQDVEMVDGEESQVDDDTDKDHDEEEDNAGKAVVRPQQLAALFEDRPSFAMPPIRDMFDTIVSVYGKRPKLRESHMTG